MDTITSVKVCLICNPIDDVTLINIAFMLQQTMLSWPQDIMAQMYQEDADRPRPMIAELNRYIFRCEFDSLVV